MIQADMSYIILSVLGETGTLVQRHSMDKVCSQHPLSAQLRNDSWYLKPRIVREQLSACECKYGCMCVTTDTRVGVYPSLMCGRRWGVC